MFAERLWSEKVCKSGNSYAFECAFGGGIGLLLVGGLASFGSTFAFAGSYERISWSSGK
jgi:hypothetical protein